MRKRFDLVTRELFVAVSVRVGIADLRVFSGFVPNPDLVVFT